MKSNKERLLGCLPQTPQGVSHAVQLAFQQIHQEEAPKPPRRYARRLSFGAVALIVLLVTSIGVAAGIHFGVFDFMARIFGQSDALPQASELVQTNLCEKRVGNTTLRVTEAVYDGATIRFVMSIINDTIQRPLTYTEAQGGGEMGEALAKDHVTALGSFDWFTINGVEYSMTGNSIQENAVGGNDGEALIFFELLLTHSDNKSVVIPDAAFTLGIPVTQGETLTEKQMLIPIKLVAANLLQNVVPKSPTTFYQDGIAYTVTVTEAKLSPIRNVIELRVDVVNTMDEMTARKVIAPWSSIGLVDESGTEVSASTAISYGLPTDETDVARHFVIHIENVPLKNYPNELYIAPTGYYGENSVWTADMSHAIKLNMEEKRNEE